MYLCVNCQFLTPTQTNLIKKPPAFSQSNWQVHINFFFHDLFYTPVFIVILDHILFTPMHPYICHLHKTRHFSFLMQQPSPFCSCFFLTSHFDVWQIKQHHKSSTRHIFFLKHIFSSCFYPIFLKKIRS